MKNEKKYACDECGSKYSLRKSLLRHYRLKHPHVLAENVKEEDDVPLLKCNDCGTQFSLRSSLLKHCKRKNHQRPSNVQNCHRKFICHHCSTSFNIKHNLAHHIKKYHILNKTYKTDKFHCNLCIDVFKKYVDLLEHYSSHNVDIKREKLTFETDSLFLDWKKEEESRVRNSFIKHFASKTSKDGVRRDTYYCHRSGTFKSKSKGQRKLKKQGTKKIGKHCPARMYVRVSVEGEVVVDYISTHVGHDIELCHLTLTGTERMALAAKISMRIPFEDILNEVRNSANPSNLKRCDLLTRRDLNNIERCFNLTSIRNQNDSDNVDMWAPDISTRNSECPPQQPEVVPQTESFVESKIKFINDLAQLINDHVNCPEELTVAQNVVEPLLSELLAVKKTIPPNNIDSLKPTLRKDVQPPNVICVTSNITDASIQIIHAPAQFVHAPTQLVTAPTTHIFHENEIQTAHVIDVIPTNVSYSSPQVLQNSSEIVHNLTQVVNGQPQLTNTTPNVEQETLSLPLINLETIFHNIN